mgnify:CR=1 FL=1
MTKHSQHSMDDNLYDELDETTAAQPAGKHSAGDTPQGTPATADYNDPRAGKPVSTGISAKVLAGVLAALVAFALVLGGCWLYQNSKSVSAAWPGDVRAAEVSKWMRDADTPVDASEEDVDELTKVACDEYSSDHREDNSVANAVGAAIDDKDMDVATDAEANDRNVIISSMALSYRCPQYIGGEIK